MKTTRRVLVTRPAKEAEHWVRRLSALGFHALPLPLISIAPPPDPDPVARARAKAARFAALMFVSPNAVRGFLGRLGGLEPVSADDLVAMANDVRAWSPGPGTTSALVGIGWPPECIDAPDADAPQFDSEALWSQVCTQLVPGQRVLIVRGANANGDVAGRQWLATQLRERGVEVEEVAAYCRALPTLDAAQRQIADAASADGSVWVFSSSEAISNLTQLLPERDWRSALAIATHDRIGLAAQRAGFGRVIEVRPTLEALAASIESLA